MPVAVLTGSGHKLSKTPLRFQQFIPILFPCTWELLWKQNYTIHQNLAPSSSLESLESTPKLLVDTGRLLLELRDFWKQKHRSISLGSAIDYGGGGNSFQKERHVPFYFWAETSHKAQKVVDDQQGRCPIYQNINYTKRFQISYGRSEYPPSPECQAHNPGKRQGSVGRAPLPHNLQAELHARSAILPLRSSGFLLPYINYSNPL